MTLRPRTPTDHGALSFPGRVLRIALRGQREHGHLCMGVGTQPPEEFLIKEVNEMLDALRQLMEERSAVLM